VREDEDDGPGAPDARAPARRQFLMVVAPGVALVGVCLIIWLVAGGGGFWPIWVVLGVLVTVVWTGRRAFGPPPRMSEAAQHRAAMRETRRRRRRWR
jgi:hypothetical protein